jgi:anaerobic C4-dicarboxylate transporter DcuA
MVFLHLAIVLGAIFLGARLGSIGIGFAGGFGVLVLALTGVKPGAIPIDVMLIIMAVIACIGAMQVAGGLDFLVSWAEKLLRKHPTRITFYAPLVTFFMTVMAGTGHTAFSTLPVIAEVAKEQGIRPSRPLSIATVSSQIAITASPISAAVVFFATIMEPFGVDYIDILLVCIPTTLLAVICTSFVANKMGKELKDDPVYQERLAAGVIKMRGTQNIELLPYAKLSVWIFLGAVLGVMFYATALSPRVTFISNDILPLTRDHAIIAFMLTAATAIAVFCKIKCVEVLSAPTFKSGMSAVICVLGVAWLGTSFVAAYTKEINALAGDLLNIYPWLLAVALFFSSMLLYSQAATTRTLMPMAATLVVAGAASPLTLVASFAAVSALFVLPTYPTLLAAVEFDDTGSTRIGKYVFDHPFFIPGVLNIVLAVLFAFIWGGIIL